MTYFMVDVEADGPIPGDFSIICFGAVIVEAELSIGNSSTGTSITSLATIRLGSAP
jgi:hypothetical protein